ncbi:hypothetical protein BGZ96_012468 [Linnemannia gamsii]|uniref:Uncharacterized protein n=1 Tax=Linnemannia gamsii TaxID=64522 RepID=A0ABQ7JQL4_9FUNG|nr:hypothetical protein BGZ96_012468 [Linnemannia gamsii]
MTAIRDRGMEMAAAVAVTAAVEEATEEVGTDTPLPVAARHPCFDHPFTVTSDDEDEVNEDVLVEEEQENSRKQRQVTGFRAKPDVQQFLVWLFDIENARRIIQSGTTAGTKLADVQREVASIVNAAMDELPPSSSAKKITRWTAQTVKDKFRYIKDQFDKCAKLMNSTGNGDTETSTLTETVSDITPYYDELILIFGSQLTRNHPPLRVSAAPGKATFIMDDPNLEERAPDEMKEDIKQGKSDLHTEKARFQEDVVEFRAKNKDRETLIMNLTKYKILVEGRAGSSPPKELKESKASKSSTRATVDSPRNVPLWNAPPYSKDFVPLPWKPVTGLKSFKWALKTRTPIKALCHPVIAAFTFLLSILPAAWIILNNPELESIELENFFSLDATSARSFLRVISGLQNLKKIRIFNRDHKILETFVFALFKCLPLSVESIQLDFSISPENSEFFEEIAVKVDTVHISSASIQGILTSCRVLTSFTIHHHFDWRSVLNLEDAIQTSWVCTGIETLDIAIEVEPSAVPQPGYRQCDMWGDFARQIGRLKELKSLRLMALPPIEGYGPGSGMYDECLLPGFLTLNQNSAAAVAVRKGFLSYLGTLTKLEDLQGSFHLNRDTLSEAEIDWIKERWQKIRMLELYPARHFSTSRMVDLTAPVKRIRSELGIRINAYPELKERVWC